MSLLLDDSPPAATGSSIGNSGLSGSCTGKKGASGSAIGTIGLSGTVTGIAASVVFTPIVVSAGSYGGHRYGNQINYRRKIEREIQEDDEELLEILNIIMVTEDKWAA